ncbi:MAG: MBL fold metallo-hydrolase [Myxococcota bacterium]|nr:MBL fold metallo-hydrolase [Myxococcota bacterium]
MLEIHQFRYGVDNLAYVVCGPREAMAIDGGAVAAIQAFLLKTQRVLKYVVNTHGHGDHTVGNAQLLAQTDAVLLDSFEMATKGAAICLSGQNIGVIPTPGHSADSVVFFSDGTLITGDTLFNGTVGNCFTGDLVAFYRSLQRLLAFPPQTRIYAGHDYVRESVQFAKTLEPDNRALDRFLAAYKPDCVVSTLAEERSCNPFLRYNEPAIVAALKRNDLPIASEIERWCSVMTL